MLAPEDRVLLPEAIRPEPGYRLDHALITTYSLDLTALLAVPLALTFLDWDDEGGRPRLDPIALLESLRSHASRMTVLCQAGAIGVPRSQQGLYAYLESSVRPVIAPAGSFHPKLWVLRYTTEDPDLDPIHYRVLCASRNLTFDRSWDVLVALDGFSEGRRRRAKPSPELAGFIEDVTRLAQDSRLGLTQARASALNAIARDISYVDFEPPPDFDTVRFHAFGFRPPPGVLDSEADRTLAASPFLDERIIRRLSSDESTLVSRQEELDLISQDVLDGFKEVLVLDDMANPEEEDDQAGDQSTLLSGDGRDGERLAESFDGVLRGLHAKVYVFDVGRRTRLLAGSANATHSGFSASVEFLVELEGPKRKIGVREILGDERSGLRSVLRRYVRTPDVETDADLENAERLADRAGRSLGGTLLELRVSELAGDASATYELALSAPDGLPRELGDVEVTVWPITINAERGERLTSATLKSCRWSPLETAQLIGFLGCNIRASAGRANVEREITLCARLVGAPADRDAAVTRKILDSPERLMKYLAFLLSDLDRDPSAAMEMAELLTSEPGWKGPTSPAFLADDFPLFESLVQALDHDPSRIDRVQRLISDLRTTVEGRALLPPGFDVIWAPVLEARRTMKETPK